MIDFLKSIYSVESITHRHVGLGVRVAAVQIIPK